MVNHGINNLPIRPIVLNLNTATYNLAKYLFKLLSPLQQLGNTAKNTKEFIKDFKQKLSQEHKMLSFDVKSLFTNVPFNHKIEIILRTYKKNEIVTSVTKNEMKGMLILCTKNVHLICESKTHVQTDGVAMDSPLGPTLVDIFMIELENSLPLNLAEYITFWKRYVHDTICFV